MNAKREKVFNEFELGAKEIFKQVKCYPSQCKLKVLSFPHRVTNRLAITTD